VLRRDGGVVDDLIAYLHGPDDVLLVPNAANAAEVLAGWPRRPAGVEVTDRHREVAVLAVQGPRSPEVLGGLGLPGTTPTCPSSHRLRGGADVTVCRTGYTGEHGYELLAPPPTRPASCGTRCWQAAAGRAASGPCGLGARDTLRTEMGYPLHGQELSLEITPNQARPAGRSAGRSPAFWGREALLAESMTASVPAASRRAPNPSARSATPSRCRQPVRTARTARPHSAGSGF
jgi:aminomethyltransferase